MSVKNDMIEATAIITGKWNNEYAEYDRIYPFTTENLKDVYHNLDGKDVLTIVGSGDQYLNAYAGGAKTVDVFDINKLSIYYLKLKKCAVEHLSYTNYMNLFKYNSLEIYNGLKIFLDDETKAFWDYYFSHFILNDKASFICTNLFYGIDSFTKYKTRNNYFDEDTFYNLQDILPFKDINFISSPLVSLHENIHKQYDVIFLSNICQYTNPNHIKGIVLNLMNKLKENGLIYYSYIYADRLEYDESIRIFDDHDELDVPSVIKSDSQDKVLIIKK